jgi:hypothetical protein
MVAEQEGANEDYNADLFLIEEQEHRSASFHAKEGINGGRIPKEWILLDIQSMTDAFSNPAILKNIHEVQGSLTIHTHAGKAVTKMKGTVPDIVRFITVPKVSQTLYPWHMSPRLA